MNGLDIAIALAALGAFVGGYRRGLLVRACSIVGLVLGVALVGQNMASIVDALGPPPQSRRLLYIGVILAFGALVGRGAGLAFGRWLRGRVPTHTIRRADRLAGGAIGIVGVIVTTWLVVPVMAHIPGWPSESSRASATARLIDKRLPRPPDLMGSVRRLTKGGRFPVVVSALQRSFDTGAAPQEALLDGTTQQLVKESVIEVTATTCGVVSDGSGFSVGNGSVVTNAHVVTGATSVSIVDNAGVSHPAAVTYLDPAKDLALLQVDGYSAASLSFAAAELGDPVGVFGQSLRGFPIPAGIREKLDAVGRDIYDRKRTIRPVLVLSGTLEPGDSGAAVVARSGRLVGVAFAVAPDRSGTAYAIPVSELQRFLDEAPTSKGVGVPGRCI